MKLNRLTVENWRGIKNATLDFDKGVTIVGGPNESGKSSLKNALRAALLLPTGVRGEKKILEANRPWETRLFPMVELELIVEDKVCVVHKEFLRTKKWAELQVNGRLVAEDEEVQLKLLQLLGQSADWIDTLWGVQGSVILDNPAPDSIKGRLAAAAQDTVMPAVSELHTLINDEFEEYWTKQTRKPTKKIQTVRDGTMQAERAVDTVKQEIHIANQRSEEVSEKRKQLERLKNEHAKVAQEWQCGQESLAVWESYALAKKNAEHAEEDAKRCEQWQTIWKQSVSSATTLWPECRKWQKEVDELKEQLEDIPSRGGVDALLAKQKYLELALAAEKYQAVEAVQAPDPSELQKLRKLDEKLREIDTRLKMGAFKASLTAETALEMQVTRDKNSVESFNLKETQSESWTAEQAFEVHLPGIARLKVESGSPTIVEDIASRSDLQNELNTALQEWKANSIAELQERTQEKEIKLRQLQKVDSKQLIAARLKVVDVDSLDTLPQEEKEQVLVVLPALITAEESKWQTAQQQHVQAVTKQQQLNQNNPVAKLDGVIKGMQAHWMSKPFEQTESLEVPQTLSENWFTQLQSFEIKWAPILEKKKAEAGELRAKVIRPEGDEVTKDRLNELQKQKDATAPAIQNLSDMVNQMIGSIEAQGDLYARLVSAEEHLAKCQADETRVELDAGAIRILMEAFETVRDRLQKDVVAPLENRVSSYFSTITAGFYNSVKFDQSLKLNGIATATVNAVPLDDVSFGTREQLSLLTRLCLAELLAKDNAGQVVILDDNLVHTDDNRMELACRLLENASDEVQIIVFTCHPERYLHIKGGGHVKVPGN